MHKNVRKLCVCVCVLVSNEKRLFFVWLFLKVLKLKMREKKKKKEIFRRVCCSYYYIFLSDSLLQYRNRCPVSGRIGRKW